MSRHPANPPYFDRLREQLATADPNAHAAFSRHVHWGYWSDPTQGAHTVADYSVAAERLCLELLESAKIRDGSRILDVGCGFGGTLACLNERHARVELTGVNIDLPQLQRAAMQVKPQSDNRVNLVLADAARLPFADASLDVALAVEAVFHFDRPRFFAEISRVLRAGGSLTLSDFIPHERAAPYLEAIDFRGNEAIRATYGSIDVSWSIERYRDLAAKHGLTISEVRDVTPNTLPTYDVLRQLSATWSNQTDAMQFTQATGLLEKASRRGILGYQIVRFEKC